MLQFPWLVLRCMMIVCSRHVDRVLAVFPEGEFLLAGYVVAVLARRPLYLYFHNTFYENRKGPWRVIADGCNNAQSAGQGTCSL